LACISGSIALEKLSIRRSIFTVGAGFSHRQLKVSS
jgi:hypothetical protein